MNHLAQNIQNTRNLLDLDMQVIYLETIINWFPGISPTPSLVH